jgi:hypothetical protein
MAMAEVAVGHGSPPTNRRGGGPPLGLDSHYVRPIA